MASMHELFDGSRALDLTPEDKYRAVWAKKTTKQIERELASMHRHVQRHSSAYAWHGTGITPPGSLADGDKIIILREILQGLEGEK